MKRIVVVAMLTIIALAGIASATVQETPLKVDVNVYNNEVICYEIVSVTPYEPTSVDYTIKFTSSLIETDELVGSIAGHAYASSGTALIGEATSSIYDSVEGEYTTKWNFCLKDGPDDSNDESQVGTEYVIVYNVYFPAGSTSGQTIVDTTHTFATAVPEFPTIALPVAAILGLAFFIQRRKQE
jgi:hypothetical protein